MGLVLTPRRADRLAEPHVKPRVQPEPTNVTSAQWTGAIEGADGVMLYQGVHSGEGLEVEEGFHSPSDLMPSASFWTILTMASER